MGVSLLGESLCISSIVIIVIIRNNQSFEFNVLKNASKISMNADKCIIKLKKYTKRLK